MFAGLHVQNSYRPKSANTHTHAPRALDHSVQPCIRALLEVLVLKDQGPELARGREHLVHLWSNRKKGQAQLLRDVRCCGIFS